MQRLRVLFSRREEIKYISHLDIVRLWQRAFVRAGIPVAHSEGFSPHPRISLAVPLAVGVTSEAELMDVFCDGAVSPHWFNSAVGRQLPPGMAIQQVQPVPALLPSLQSVVRWAEYRADMESHRPEDEARNAISDLMARSELPWQHKRDTGVRSYNLRALIDSLELAECQGGHFSLAMRLRCDSTGSGRPEQVAAALGFAEPPVAIHRTKLVLG